MSSYSKETSLQRRFRSGQDLHLRDHSPEDYLVQNFDRQTCIHIAAVSGGIQHIPAELLTAENLGTPDAFGNSVLHLAAESGLIGQLPLETIPASLFWKNNNHHQTAFSIASANGNIDQIPLQIRLLDPSHIYDTILRWCESPEERPFRELLDPKIWTQQVSDKSNGQTVSPLHLAAQYNRLHLLPKEITTIDALLTQNSNGQSPLSISVLNGSLARIIDRIPEDFDWRQTLRCPTSTTYLHLLAKNNQLHLLQKIDPDLLSEPDASGETVLDLLYKAGRIDTVPADIRWRQETYRETKVRELITQNRISELPSDFQWQRPMSDGKIPLHIAAACGSLSQVPEQLLPEDAMLLRDSEGRTPLECALTNSTLNRVPRRLLTAKTVSEKNRQRQSLVDCAFRKGCIDTIPEELRSLSGSFLGHTLKKAAKERNFAHPIFLNSDFLASSPPSSPSRSTWYHWLADEGVLASLPADLTPTRILQLRDKAGLSPLHVAVAKHGIRYFPAHWLTTKNLLDKDANGNSAFHFLATLEALGDLPPELCSKEALLSCNNDEVSVADEIENYGNTDFLPERLRYLSKAKAGERLDSLFLKNFPTCEALWKRDLSDIITRQQFEQARNEFVREWSKAHFKHALDEQQTEAVIASDCDLLVSARAGSGKTGTLVARALFEVEKRKADPTGILILAFNKKAAAEVRERLAEQTGENRCPHVLTFHSLAYRLVHPERGSILMDDKDTEEGQALSQKLNDLIDDEIRRGELVEEIRMIMEFRWEAEWEDIVESGGLLPDGAALALRETRQFHAIDGRRFESPAEKVVADELVKRGKKYFHRPVVFRRSGNIYTPAFSVGNGSQRVIIDIEGTADAGCLQAGHLYWNSDQSSSSRRFILKDFEGCGGAEKFRSELVEILEGEDLGWIPLSDEQIWESIKKRHIRNFTSAVTSFLGRCQTELWTPDLLEQNITKLTGKSAPHEWLSPPELRACLLFWQVCQRFWIVYLDRLRESGKTDFDHLMIDAAATVRQGMTSFRSEWSRGDLAEIKHVYVDEYQDFSHLFNNLREAIQEKNPGAQFFCVGDDWQAINGFAGSNLRYFHGFPDMFSNSQKLEILRNYRSAPEIVNLGNQVMAGKGSPSVSTKDSKGRVLQIFADLARAENGDWEDCVEDQLGPKAVPLLKLISRSMQEGKMLLVLFRNRKIWTSRRSLLLEDYRRELLSWLEKNPQEQLVFSTTHSYKGGEADQVVMVDPEDYPNLHEDRIFNAIFGDTDARVIEDEKRLFYVGVTRAKEQLVFLRDNKTKIKRGQPLKVDIPFLSGTKLKTASLAKVPSPVFPDDRCLVRISCEANNLGGKFRKAEFVYIEHKKIWRRLLSQSPPQNRFECTEFLKSLPWLKDLGRYSVDFEWADQKEVFNDQGQPGKPSPVISDSQKEELDGIFDSRLRRLIESTMIDQSIPFPVIGFDGGIENTADGSQLEVAWPDYKIGIAMPGQETLPFKNRDWTILSGETITTADLLRVFAPSPQTGDSGNGA